MRGTKPSDSDYPLTRSAMLCISARPLPLGEAKEPRANAHQLVPLEGQERVRADAVLAQQVEPAEIGQIDEERRARNEAA